MSASHVPGLASEAPTAAQMKELFAQIESGRITKAIMQIWLREGGLPDIDWARVYDALGMSAEYAIKGMTMLLEGAGHWLVPVVAGVTPNKIVATLRRLGVAVYTYRDDLDAAVPTNDRDPKNGSYAVHFKKTVEADPEFANLSANDLRDREISGITLTERLLLELGYFLATGKHLDVENVTLCSDSRYSDGYVPYVYWYPSFAQVYVNWFHPDYRLGDLRARAAV